MPGSREFYFVVFLPQVLLLKTGNTCGGIALNEFIAIDFETAAYSPDSAISVGLVKYRDFKVIDVFYSLIRPPQLYVRPDFTDIHGLTADDVKDAPFFDQVWEDKICGFIGTTLLAAHNASFDMKVLGATLGHYGIILPALNYFCSLSLSRRVWPQLRSNALTSLGREFNITYDAHNALADAETCGKIISLCVHDVAEKKGMEEPLAITEALQEAGVETKKLGLFGQRC